MSVCLCVMKVGSSRDGTTVVTRDLPTYYTLYCACMITSEHTQGASAKEVAVREQQLKWTQSGSSKLKQMQSGSSSWRLEFTRDTTTQGCWCVRVGGCARLMQTWWRRWDHRSITMSAVKERTVVHCAVLTRMEVTAPPTSAQWRAAGAEQLT